VPIDARALRPDDSAFSAGRGCYTTARFRGGRIRFLERHSARLARDARRLGIGSVDPARVAEALAATGRANFAEAPGGGDGVVRVQASRDGAGALHLTAVPRSAGPEPAVWRACTAPMPHEGPMPWSGAKVSNHLLFALAGDHARAAGCDEALLLDRHGYLVEGSRSNLLVVGKDGRLATPDLARGGVAGVGLEVLRERVPEISVRHVPQGELLELRELIAVNAIRGPKPIVSLDGREIGDGRPGPISRRLAECFAED
jgi:branched-subunit amino acid aminotransferase/4-amino-4-deoxychorismate lyase